MSFSSPSSSHHATNLQCILGEESRLHYAVMHKNIQDANGTTIPPPSLSRSKSTGSFSSSVPPRRLSSGSACEVCRRRKTKCDGGNPCAFCSANRIECVHRATRRKKSSLAISQTNNDLCKASSSSNKPSTTTTTTTSTGFQLQEATPSPTASSPSWANTASTTSPAQSTTTHMTSLTYQSARAFPAAAVGGTTNTTTANRYNMGNGNNMCKCKCKHQLSGSMLFFLVFKHRRVYQEPSFKTNQLSVVDRLYALVTQPSSTTTCC